MPNTRPELVANIWPIMDRATGIIQRFAARAYAMPTGNDELISAVLLGLAQTDFHTAKQYPVPERFKLASGGSEICGAVPPHGFNEHSDAIIDDALEDLARSCPDVVGISMKTGAPKGVSLGLAFPREPYPVVTYLLEHEDGTLVPQLGR